MTKPIYLAILGLACMAEARTPHVAAATRLSMLAPITADLIVTIRRALSSRDPSAQQRLMTGLRGLGDPSLVPLFSQVAEYGGGGARVQAILALAELNPAQGLDLLLVRRLPPADQAALLGEAIRANLLTAEHLIDVSRWADLDPLMTVSASARLAAFGKPIDRERLALIGADIDKVGPRRPAAVLAIATLAQTASNDEQLPEYLRAVQAVIATPLVGAGPAAKLPRLANQPPPMDCVDVRGVLLAVRQFRLTRLAPVVDAVLSRGDLDNLTRAECVATLMEIEPGSNRTLSAWLGAFNRDGADRGDSLRLGVMALRLAGAIVPAESASPERNALVMAERLGARRDELLSAMGAAIAALAARGDAGVVPGNLFSPQAASAICALVRLRHGASSLWAAELGSIRREASGAQVCANMQIVRVALIESAPSIDGAATDLQLEEAATRAAEAIAESDPQLALEILEKAAATRREGLALLLLAGALRQSGERLALHRDSIAALAASAIAGQDRTAELAAGLPPLRIVALATLLRARALNAMPGKGEGVESLSNDERAQQELARIAEPDSPLSEPARIQAAWMTIRARQQDRLALTQIMAEVGPQTQPDAR